MPDNERQNAVTRARSLGCVLAVMVLLAPGVVVPRAAGEDAWVRYHTPGTRPGLTVRWRAAGSDGTRLVIKVETFLDGELKSTREMKAARLQVPEQHRRETIVAGGRQYDCQVFELKGTTFWVSEDVPLLGIVRSRTGDRDTLELLDFSAGRRP